MKCARCGECCKETKMEISESDVSRLTGLGFRREEICVEGKDGIVRLQNVDGACVFLSEDGKSCSVYTRRPVGCDIYPVNCDEDGNVFLDEFCKARRTVTKEELQAKGAILRAHLRTIDKEAAARRMERN